MTAWLESNLRAVGVVITRRASLPSSCLRCSDATRPTQADPTGSGRVRCAPAGALAVVLMALAFVAGACTGGGSDADQADQADDESADVAGSIGTDTGERLEADDVEERELRYRCDSVVFTPDDADAGSVETAAGTVTIESLGTPLPTWLVGSDGLFVPCVAVNATVNDLRPVAFELSGDQLVVEACVDHADLVVDRREAGGATVITVFGPAPDAVDGVVGAECAIDPDAPLSSDLVGGPVPATTLSGVTYPFGAPSAVLHEQLGFGVGLASLPVADPASVICRALPATRSVEVQWSGLEPGYRAEVRVGDDVRYRSEPAGVDGAPSVTGAYILAMFDRGVTVSDPDFVNSFADFGATGDLATYVLDVVGGSGEATSIVCGEAGVGGAGTAPLLDPAEQTNTIGGDLGAAKSLFDAVAILPFVYQTIEPICDGCDGDEVPLILVPDGTAARQFDPPVEQQADPALPGLVDPFALHELLAAAEANGRDVSYVIDPSSGVPIEWTIDGRGARITCLEVDIAPPELRPTTACRTDLDLIGR